MAELHVGAGYAIKTLVKAASAAKAGDVIVVHAGVYAGGLKPPAGTTWVAADAGAVVIDGGWKGNNLAATDANGYGVMISAPGVVIRGFEVRNVAGRGVVIAAGGDGLILEDFEIHHTFSGGLVCNGSGTPIADITIRRGHVHDISLSGRWRETPVNGCFLFKDAAGLLVEDMLIERGHGEGIAADTRSARVTFRRVTVRNTVHLAMYVANSATDVLVEDCVVYQSGADEWRQNDGGVGAGFVIGDEVAEGKDRNRPHSENVTMRRCVAVNCSGALQVRNGTRVKNGLLDGYDTRIQNLLVEHCTFVGGPNARWGVTAGENDRGATVRGVIRNCVMVFDLMAPDDEQVRVVPPGLALEGNVWTAGVPAGLPASNWAGRATALVAPFATLADGGFSIDNYRPVAGGPLDGAGVGALEVKPPSVEAWVMADFEQEPSAGPAPLEVRFTDRSTAGGNAVITAWAWEFGDGATSVEPSPVHVYATPGTYRARLMVTDEGRALSYFVVGPEIVVAEVGPEPPEEPEPPESIWDKLLEVAAALGECLAEMAGERAAAEASLAEAERQLAASAEDHDTAAGLLGELLLRLDECRQGEEEDA